MLFSEWKITYRYYIENGNFIEGQEYDQDRIETRLVLNL